MRRDRNHPSIIGWCPFNETQTDQDQRSVGTVYRVTKQLDNTRPVSDDHNIFSILFASSQLRYRSQFNQLPPNLLVN